MAVIPRTNTRPRPAAAAAPSHSSNYPPSATQQGYADDSQAFQQGQCACYSTGSPLLSQALQPAAEEPWSGLAADN